MLNVSKVSSSKSLPSTEQPNPMNRHESIPNREETDSNPSKSTKTQKKKYASSNELVIGPHISEKNYEINDLKSKLTQSK